jgi:hypothetical protein
MMLSRLIGLGLLIGCPITSHAETCSISLQFAKSRVFDELSSISCARTARTSSAAIEYAADLASKTWSGREAEIEVQLSRAEVEACSEGVRSFRSPVPLVLHKAVGDIVRIDHDYSLRGIAWCSRSSSRLDIFVAFEGGGLVLSVQR